VKAWYCSIDSALTISRKSNSAGIPVATE
jgi:hypothetical protein